LGGGRLGEGGLGGGAPAGFACWRGSSLPTSPPIGVAWSGGGGEEQALIPTFFDDFMCTIL